jgi:glycosyltransferase involved in cell wall biosynthesis
MNVCFIIEYYYPHVGGFEVLFQHLAEGLVQAGHRCTVVTCRLPGTLPREITNGVHLHRVRVPVIGDRYWFTLFSGFAAWKHARSADIIGTTTYNGTLTAWILARFFRKPAVMVNLEVVGKNWSRIGLNPLLALFYRLMENAALFLPFDRHICISRYTLNSLMSRGAAPDKLSLAYPGVDYALFDPQKVGHTREAIRKNLSIRQDDFIYLYFGRPGFVKGVEYLVKAVPQIRQKVPRARLLMILSRKPSNGYRRIEELMAELNLKRGKDIIIIDPVRRDELPDYLRASDCVVVPSLSEGFGFTCVEACTMGIPVVATEVGSIPEVIFGKYVLVNPRDPSALAVGVEKVYSSQYSTSDGKIFLWDDMVKKHIGIYEALLASPNNRKS